jgi:hypothetical protein
VSHLPHANEPTFGQPGPYDQQSYGQRSYGPPQPYQPYQPAAPYPRPYFQPQPEHPEGTTILVLGVLGFVVLPCGIIAWYMGSKALKAIRASGITYSNESNINVGKILGMVTSIIGMVAVGLLLVQIVFYFVFWMAAMASMATI